MNITYLSARRAVINQSIAWVHQIHLKRSIGPVRYYLALAFNPQQITQYGMNTATTGTN